MIQIDERHLLSGSGGSGKNEGEPSEEAPNNLITIAYAKVLDLLCHGPIKGLANGVSSYYLDNIPLRSPGADERNFKGVSFQFRRGLTSQDVMEGFDSVRAEEVVSQQVVKLVPITRTISDATINHIVIKIMVPALLLVEEDDGDIVPTTVDLIVWGRQSPAGSWVNLANVTISGKTNTSYERATRINNLTGKLGAGPWDIKVERVTDDSADSRLQNQTWWSSYTTIINSQLYYPRSVVCGTIINSKQFGNRVPERSWDVYGLNNCRIPSNYDPWTNTYTGVWDGTWSTNWTDNPAWVFLEVATNKIWGAGHPLASMNKWKLYEIAKYCDELVPNYRGGVERRWTFNGVIQGGEQAYQVLNALASGFLSMPLWGTGLVTLVQDAPADATHIATNANVEGGVFTYSGSGMNARYSVVFVTWNDPDNNYEASVEIVRDKDLLRAYGWRKKDVLAVGCTSRSQAVRYGRWILETVKSEKDIVAFRGGLYYADAAPGNIIQVQDKHFAGLSMSGRVVSESTTTLVKLDRSVTIEAGKTYTISLSLPEGLTERALSAVPGSYTEFTVAALPSAPFGGVSWVVSSSTLAPRQFRVVANRPVKDGKSEIKFDITAMSHDVNKYARIYRDQTFEDVPPATVIPTGKIAKPTGIDTRTFTYSSGGSNWKVGILLSWTEIPDPRVVYYDVQRRISDTGNWTVVGQTTVPSIEIRPIKPATWDFRIRGRGVGVGPWAEENAVVIADPNAPPPDVTGLTVSGPTSSTFFTRDCHLSWDDMIGATEFPVNRFKHYRVEIRTADGVTLKRAILTTSTDTIYSLDKNIKDFGGTTGQPSASFMVRVYAVDIYLVKSTSPAQLVASSVCPATIANLRCIGGPNNTTFLGKDCEVEWDDPRGANLPKDAFKHYRLRIKSTGDVVKRTKKIPDVEHFTYSYDVNVNDFTTPTPSFKVEVGVVNVYNVISSLAQIMVTNPAPNISTMVLTLQSSWTGLWISWESNPPSDPDIRTYRVLIEPNDPPVAVQGRISGDRTAFYYEAQTIKVIGLHLYVRLVPVDWFGQVGTGTAVFDEYITPVQADVGTNLYKQDGVTLVTESDLFLDGLWARTITLAAGGVFRSSGSYPRFEITKDYIRGMSDAVTEECRLDAITGKILAGEGMVRLEEAGIRIGAPDASTPQSRLTFWDDSFLVPHGEVFNFYNPTSFVLSAGLNVYGDYEALCTKVSNQLGAVAVGIQDAQSGLVLQVPGTPDPKTYYANLFYDYSAGTVELQLNVDVVTPASEVQAFRLVSLCTSPSAPLVVNSAVLCTNLNADLWDGYQFSDYLNQAVKTTSAPTFTSIQLTTGVISRDIDTSGLFVYGGSAGAYGAGLLLYGRDHATLPGNAYIDVGGYDATGSFIVRARNTAGTLTTLLTISNSQVATFPGRIVSSLATGTKPFDVTSTTLCTNLNADLWDGYQFDDYLDQAVKQASSPTFVSLSFSTGLISRTSNTGSINLVGGTLAANGASLLVYGRDHATLPGRAIFDIGGYDSIGLLTFRHRNTAGGLTNLAAFDLNKVLRIGDASMPSGPINCISLKNGTAPSSGVADSCYFFSEDITAGNAAPHFLTEGGIKLRLYQQAHIADGITSHATTSFPEVNLALDALAGKINSILAVLENLRLLATS